MFFLVGFFSEKYGVDAGMQQLFSAEVYQESPKWRNLLSIHYQALFNLTFFGSVNCSAKEILVCRQL